MSGSCANCKSKSLVRDFDSESLVCESCGFVQEFDNFQDNFGGINGPQGTFVRVGTAGLGSKAYEIKTMVSSITEGEYGVGDWFGVFVGACAYVVMRKDKRSLPMPMAEVSSVVGCDEFELGKMVSRVVKFLNLKRPEYPEFNVLSSFERALQNSHIFGNIGDETRERIRRQGIFLIQCMVKWSLTTGRRPVAVVAAVLVFLGELNQIENVRIENVAKEVHATVCTSKLRYKELMEALVKVAQALPWGKNVNIKNIVNNAPFVIQYMEHKSMSKSDEKRNDLERLRFELEDVVSECLSKDVDYENDMVNVDDGIDYFKVDLDSNKGLPSIDDMEKFQLSSECLMMIYEKFSNEVGCKKSSRESGSVVHRRENRNFDIGVCTEWWSGESELSKKLLLKQILEKDVGLNALPPSFVNNCKVYEKRREKINAAKRRIDRIMFPSNSDDCVNNYVVDCEQLGKKRKRAKFSAIDWEDLIIEMLLLHQVKEEEIEKGHYNTLMDLYVFNSGIVPDFPA
ncbi:plant-specific TFIIB-related protein PTF2 isoform X2 [Cannabis sativa]|uniref:plant-specific TFIIB-related protein PTF2 isoform X2 n=1 Tax=Cannabis sativa TaxID=3483 RepID=UPI0011DF5E2A|nr:plant-specific TFIIB-related protein PTF2 isoform X2 [Cannabis sativa]